MYEVYIPRTYPTKSHPMPRPSRLLLDKDDILALLSKNPKAIYSPKQLATIFHQNRRTWHLAQSTKPADFVAFLIKHGELRERTLRSQTYGNLKRYSWGDVTAYEVALSVRQRAYFCHETALVLHGLITDKTKNIFINVEQSSKPSNSYSLSQDGIDLAFSRQQRQSKLFYKCMGSSIIVVAGKNTNRLGVEEVVTSDGSSYPVTNLERALIDVV